MTLSKSLLPLLLASLGAPAFAADYYVVVPLQGKQALLNGISVSLNNTSLPTGMVGVPYQGFDLSQAVQVTGDRLTTQPMWVGAWWPVRCLPA